MYTLTLQPTLLKGGPGEIAREYLDFLVSGQSLATILGLKNVNLVSPLTFWKEKAYDKKTLNIFRLKERSELESGRVMIYVCPACGDIDCGAVTALISDRGDRIIWQDFASETG